MSTQHNDELWLVVKQSNGVRAHVLAVGPWPSTSRRAIAEAAWQRDSRTISVARSLGRPVADEYIAPRLTKSERAQLARRFAGEMARG